MTPEQTDGGSEGAVDGGGPGALTIALWPEALLIGTVKTADGEPLSHVSVLVRRSLFDEQGRHSQIAGQRQTDSHGEFRLPVPAGDYRVETQFSAKGFERQQALLPSVFPPRSSSVLAETVHVESGQEQHVELRPATAKTYVVTLPIDTGDEGSASPTHGYASDGTSFPSMPPVPKVQVFSMSISHRAPTFFMPPVLARRIQFGESSVTVPDHDLSGPPLHLSPLPNIPVEMIVETSTSPSSTAAAGRFTDTAPNIMQFNLALQPLEVDPTSPFQFGVRPTQQQNSSATLAAPPGTYQLSASANGGWYIRSANSRGTDLLRDNLTITPGSTPSPITLSSATKWDPCKAPSSSRRLPVRAGFI